MRMAQGEGCKNRLEKLQVIPSSGNQMPSSQIKVRDEGQQVSIMLLYGDQGLFQLAGSAFAEIVCMQACDAMRQHLKVLGQHAKTRSTSAGIVQRCFHC
ncbi:hypothetical protein SDC9_73027 [bioreactor metagenome]|uniref:Uncharacterized protein n=1 Tax=bioreactor metagenome TaxID=1076179 RepID=A0A644YJ50_9ZZZZ